jgi:hypothetical protein
MKKRRYKEEAPYKAGFKPQRASSFRKWVKATQILKEAA